MIVTSFISAARFKYMAIVDSINDVWRMLSWDGTNWSLVGNSFSLGAQTISPGLYYIGGNSFASAGAFSSATPITGNVLRTLYWDGVDFSQLGNALALSFTPNSAAMALISPGTVALYCDTFPQTSDALRTFTWDGSDWSQIGTPLTITNSFATGMAPLGTNLIALVVPTDDTLRTYQWNTGTLTWAQVGSSFSFGANVNANSLCKLGMNGLNPIVAFFEANIGELRTYEWNIGSLTWSQLGSSLDIAETGFNNIALISALTIGLAGNNTDLIKTFAWDANFLTWSQVGNSFSYTPMGATALAGLII